MRYGRSAADVACIRDGLKDALGKGTMAVLSFRQASNSLLKLPK